MKIACVAQLVIVIAPIRAEKGGRAWKTTIYYPYQYASLYGRGAALEVAVDAPSYDCAVASDVRYLDAAAVDNGDGMVTVFLVNRHLGEAMELDMPVTGFGKLTLAKHLTIGGEGADLRTANTPDDPDRIGLRQRALQQQDPDLVRELDRHRDRHHHHRHPFRDDVRLCDLEQIPIIPVRSPRL